VTVDRKPVQSWAEVLRPLLGAPATDFQVTTVFGTAVRPGDHVQLLGLGQRQMPKPFWESIGRVSVTICYASVFDQYWTLAARLRQRNVWRDADRCPSQRPDADL
jgi:hypothetical protein